MFYEAQIILRRENADQLMDDCRAINDFIERRNAGHRVGPVDVVIAAERILGRRAQGESYAP